MSFYVNEICQIKTSIDKLILSRLIEILLRKWITNLLFYDSIIHNKFFIASILFVELKLYNSSYFNIPSIW